MPDFPGTSGNDNTYGTNENDTMFGGAGDDVLRGFGGNDTMYGGDGNDTLEGGADGDMMYGGAGNDTYIVNSLQDRLFEDLGGGIDRVIASVSWRLGDNFENLNLVGTAYQGIGNALNNAIFGNASENLLAGGDGNDSLYGGAGNDTMFGGNGNDIIDGGAGNDLVSYIDAATGVTVDLALQGAFQVTGGSGNDKLTGFERLEGSQFNDVLLGDNNANVITGRGGDDFIRGRGGNDEMSGNAGADTFRFERAGADNGFDVIRAGFMSGTDKLEFHTADGYSAAATFTVGETAVGAGPQFVFNTRTHTLSYDADGAGGAAGIDIVKFLPDLGIAFGDIRIVNDGGDTVAL